MRKEGVKLKCPRCGHEWLYKGKSEYYATCPHCLNKVNIKKCRVGGNENVRGSK